MEDYKSGGMVFFAIDIGFLSPKIGPLTVAFEISDFKLAASNYYSKKEQV